MDIVALCPFSVGTLFWRPREDAWTLTTIVKGTFTLLHGREAALAPEQLPVGADRPYNDALNILRSPSDRAPYKPRADVLCVGHAYAPRRRTEALVARIAIGDFSKALGIVGDRAWMEGADGLEPAAAAPFERMPLRYERVARGPENPVGLDLASTPFPGALALPNLESADDRSASGRSVGFGPIAPDWPSRRALLTTDDAAAWARAVSAADERVDAPAPDGFDFGFFNAAPRDQQLALLRPSARILLEHLHPELATLESRLPAMRPKAFLVESGDGRAIDVSLRCDTLWLDTDEARVAVTWRGLTTVADPSRALRLVVALEARGQDLRFKHVERMLREGHLPHAEEGEDRMPNPLGVRHDRTKPGQLLAPWPLADQPAPAMFEVDPTTEYPTHPRASELEPSDRVPRIAAAAPAPAEAAIRDDETTTTLPRARVPASPPVPRSLPDLSSGDATQTDVSGPPTMDDGEEP